MVTSRDVARVAGVSQATVSRVLQNSPRVSPATRRRVLDAFEQTGYRPNLLARAMRTQRTGTIGVVVARITNPFYPEMVEAIADRLDQAGLRMILWTSAAPGESSALEAIDQGLVDGIMFTTVTGASRPLSEAMRRRAPIVLINRGLEGLDCDQVTTENEGGSAAVARYFRAWGRERIGLIGGPSDASTAVEREAGFREALEAQGVRLAPTRYRKGDFSHESGHQGIRQFLDARHPPTAVFCVNDVTAFGAIDGARAVGARVPQDVWVAGFDDIRMAAWEAYDLTTVRQPIAEIVDTGVTLLLERIAQPGRAPQRVRLPSHLVVRRSTAQRPVPDDLPVR